MLAGGHVCKSQTTGCRIAYDDVGEVVAPVNFISPRPYLLGSGIPTRKEHINTMAALGVTLIVSLTIDPLRPGRAINHQPHRVCRPEYTDIDQDMLDGITKDGHIKVLHLPVSDGYPPTSNTMNTFLTEAKGAIDNGGKVYVHCWLGKGRTGTFLAAYLIYWEKMVAEEAIGYIRKLSPGAINAQSQVNYLTDSHFPINLQEAAQPPPVVHTAKTDECYQTKNQTTNLAMQRLLSRTTWIGNGGADTHHGGVCFIGSCDN